ncbi:hypothetical protein HY483_02855 [Candidatus Woesearchaeota archaeon]|nr:hypothetical protein [Candidatus Woesearchaeota archaeon]
MCDAEKSYQRKDTYSVVKYLDIVADYFYTVLSHGCRNENVIVATREIEYCGLIAKMERGGWTVRVDDEGRHVITVEEQDNAYILGTS